MPETVKSTQVLVRNQPFGHVPFVSISGHILDRILEAEGRIPHNKLTLDWRSAKRTIYNVGSFNSFNANVVLYPQRLLDKYTFTLKTIERVSDLRRRIEALVREDDSDLSIVQPLISDLEEKPDVNLGITELPPLARSTMLSRRTYRAQYTDRDQSLEETVEEQAERSYRDVSRLDKYIALAKEGFKGSINKKTGRPYTPDEAKERAEKFLTRITSYSLQKALGNILGHEYGHAKDLPIGWNILKSKNMIPTYFLWGAVATSVVMSIIFPPSLLVTIINYTVLGASFASVVNMFGKMAGIRFFNRKQRLQERTADEYGSTLGKKMREAVMIDQGVLRKQLFH